MRKCLQTGFPKSTNACHANAPPSETFVETRSVWVFGWWGLKKCSSSWFANRCQVATSSTHRWPGNPCPGWLQGRGSSVWPHKVSWGGWWRPFWPDQNPGSLECSRTSPQCYWASGPAQKTQHRVTNLVYTGAVRFHHDMIYEHSTVEVMPIKSIHHHWKSSVEIYPNWAKAKLYEGNVQWEAHVHIFWMHHRPLQMNHNKYNIQNNLQINSIYGEHCCWYSWEMISGHLFL